MEIKLKENYKNYEEVLEDLKQSNIKEVKINFLKSVVNQIFKYNDNLQSKTKELQSNIDDKILEIKDLKDKINVLNYNNGMLKNKMDNIIKDNSNSGFGNIFNIFKNKDNNQELEEKFNNLETHLQIKIEENEKIISLNQNLSNSLGSIKDEFFKYKAKQSEIIKTLKTSLEDSNKNYEEIMNENSNINSKLIEFKVKFKDKNIVIENLEKNYEKFNSLLLIFIKFKVILLG